MRRPCSCAVCWADRAVLRFVAFVLLLYAMFALSGCATGPTARGIALDLDARLRLLASQPLPLRCQAIKDAERRCVRAGLPRRCFADGWTDSDRDAWTLAACAERRRP